MDIRVLIKIGLALPSGLFVLALSLKLFGVLDWSWWQVTAPIWGSAGLVLLVIAGLFIALQIKKEPFQ